MPGRVRTRPPCQTQQAYLITNCIKSTPSIYQIHLLSPLFFLLRAGHLATSPPPLLHSHSEHQRGQDQHNSPLSHARRRGHRSRPGSHRGKTMNSDASSDEKYGPTELDKMIQDECFDSSDSDEEVDMIMLMSM